MCGLVGVISSYSNGFNHSEVGLFTDLLFLDTVRGFDSTGVFGVENTGNVYIHKEASNGLTFLQTKEFKEFKTNLYRDGKFVAGHNRAATRGTVVDENAHPFWVDDKIILMQNGTYKGSHTHLKDTVVDTEAVAHVIAEGTSIAESLQKVNASYALVWYNADTGELNLIRNSERPLYLAEFSTSGIAWASEECFLDFAFKRNDIKYTKKPVLIPEYTLVSFKLNNKGSYVRTDTLLEASFHQPYIPVQERYQKYSGYSGNITTIGQNQKSNIKQLFVDQINKNCKEFWFPSKEAAAKELDVIKDLAHDGMHYVEMLDYFPANEHPQCDSWHLFGVVAGQEIDNKGPALLVHWIQYNKTEEEVLNMVYGTYYKCNLSTTIMRSVADSKHNGFLLTAYATKHEVVEGVTT